MAIGTLVIAPGAVSGLLWLVLRNGVVPDPLEGYGKGGGALAGAGLALAGAGWFLYFTIDGDLGLLAVVLGGLVIAVAAIDVRQDSAGGPVDGPWYGDTGQ